MNRREREELGRRLVVHRLVVMAWLRSLGVSREEVPDAAQDVFVTAIARWHDYRPDEPLGAWLYGIARCVASNWRRTRRRRPLDLGAVYDDIGVRSHEARVIARAELAALPEHMATLASALADNGLML